MMDQALLLAQDEADHWMLAGTKGLVVWPLLDLMLAALVG